jgi:carboxyl-terminal processing protease
VKPVPLNLSATLLLFVFAAGARRQDASSNSTLTLRERVTIATRIYHEISSNYPDLDKQQFEKSYDEYVAEILGPSNDRRAFDLASMAFVAGLHDGHTWFYDTWLGKNYGQSTGFVACPIGEDWVVFDSRISGLKPGDVVERIDGVATRQYFAEKQKYLSASSTRDAETIFFHTGVLFPQRFTVTLDGGRKVVVDREHDQKQARTAGEVEGRWLTPGQIGYIKLRTFGSIEAQVEAVRYLKQFEKAKTIVIDIRGNAGGGDPETLRRSLITQTYKAWTERSALQGGFLSRSYQPDSPEAVKISPTDTLVRPGDGASFTTPLILLIDRNCSSACEDFAMPFKLTGRAKLVGEPTAGTFSFTRYVEFENGMRLNVAATRHLFPDGSTFEGVGITPDVLVTPATQDLKNGKDVVLQKALELAQ